jgi:hypothetical protein
VFVAFNPSLDELVIFELPTRRLAEGLLGQLSPKRFAWMQNSEEAVVLAALLNPDPLDLAALLRAVQSWLSRTGLVAIRFEVDGRAYVLDAVPPALLPAQRLRERGVRDRRRRA